MYIEHIVVGPLQVNCYIAYDEECREALIIDPGDDASGILRIVEKHSLLPKYIVCTHGHFDHIGAVSAVKAATGAAVVLHGEDLGLYEKACGQASAWGFSVEQPPSPDIVVAEGDKLLAGSCEVQVLHTPGHS